MIAETVLESDLISMWYYPDSKILHHVIHKYVYGEPLRSALEKGVENLKKHGACKWLSDDRSFSAVSKEDMEWGMSYWGPKAAAAGWRFWAIVLPKSITGKMSHERLIEFYGGLGVTAKVFNDADEGMAWLKEQPT